MKCLGMFFSKYIALPIRVMDKAKSGELLLLNFQFNLTDKSLIGFDFLCFILCGRSKKDVYHKFFQM